MAASTRLASVTWAGRKQDTPIAVLANQCGGIAEFLERGIHGVILSHGGAQDESENSDAVLIVPACWIVTADGYVDEPAAILALNSVKIPGGGRCVPAREPNEADGTPSTLQAPNWVLRELQHGAVIVAVQHQFGAFVLKDCRATGSASSSALRGSARPGNGGW